MTKSSLLVAFHAGVVSEHPERMRDIADRVFTAYPQSAVLATSKELIANAREDGKNIVGRFYYHINGSTHAEAVETLIKGNKDRPLAIVTLSEEMMKAASDAGVPVVTIGVPSVPSDRQFIAASPKYIPDMLRALSYCRN